MSFLKKLFKRKEGGTTFGNILRGVAKTAKTVVPIPGIAALPIGEGLMLKQSATPSYKLPVPPAYAAPVPATDVKGTLREVLQGALEGAKDGALDGYLNKTESGQEVVKDATENQVNKYMPWVAGGVILYLLYKNK